MKIRSVDDVIHIVEDRKFQIIVDPGPPPMPKIRGNKELATPGLMAALEAWRTEIIELVISKQPKVIPWNDGVVGRIVNAKESTVICESSKLIPEIEFLGWVESLPGTPLYCEHRGIFSDGKVMVERTYATDNELM